MWSWFLVHFCKMMISPGLFFIFSRFWFSRLLGRLKVKKWPKMRNNYICYTPYLRNSIAYNHNFWYTIVKWYLQVFMSFFLNFDFLGCERGKMKNNNYIHYAPYLRNSIAYDHDFRYTCVMVICPGAFFSFSKFGFSMLLGW